jgi:hypothetical protein
VGGLKGTRIGREGTRSGRRGTRGGREGTWADGWERGADGRERGGRGAREHREIATIYSLAVAILLHIHVEDFITYPWIPRTHFWDFI